MLSWTVLQLADSAFPVGGFAHSAGLEAAWSAGLVRTSAEVERFCEDHLAQITRGALPLLLGVFDEPSRLAELDELARVTTWSHVAARASRAQGRALLDAAAQVFEVDALAAARASLARGEIEGHLAPAFGFVTAHLNVPRSEASATFLHLSLRGLLSAAVRLGIVGPFESQALLHARGPCLDRALA